MAQFAVTIMRLQPNSVVEIGMYMAEVVPNVGHIIEYDNESYIVSGVLHEVADAGMNVKVQAVKITS